MFAASQAQSFLSRKNVPSPSPNKASWKCPITSYWVETCRAKKWRGPKSTHTIKVVLFLGLKPGLFQEGWVPWDKDGFTAPNMNCMGIFCPLSCGDPSLGSFYPHNVLPIWRPSRAELTSHILHALWAWDGWVSLCCPRCCGVWLRFVLNTWDSCGSHTNWGVRQARRQAFIDAEGGPHRFVLFVADTDYIDWIWPSDRQTPPSCWRAEGGQRWISYVEE